MTRTLTIIAVAAALSLSLALTGQAPRAQPPPEPAPAEASAEVVHQFCSVCHAYPPPDTFPRAAWREEVRKAYDFFRDANLRQETPDLESVVQYYERRAPIRLPAADRPPPASGPTPVAFRKQGLRPPDGAAVPQVTHVNLAPLYHRDKLDLLVCQTKPDRIWAVKLYDDPPSWHLLNDTVMAPCHVEVVDLDGDGHKDLLVAELGFFYPTKKLTGQVVWLRGDGKGRFTPHVLLDGVGRVADVQAADFQGKGKLDVVVGVFGPHKAGVLFLENQTTDWNKPRFVPRWLDERSGVIHVPIGDINGDGNPDIVALISQEHETVAAFVNEGPLDGKMHFTKKTIYTAPHPAYGSSGIQLVDMNQDGKLDVLYTNGDVFDPPALLKPYHSIQWLENRGSFPFVHHHVASMYGAMRAVAADLTGKGKLDIVAVAFLPPEEFPQLAEVKAEAVALFEQTAPGKFERHVLATNACHHLTCAVGDIYGDGRQHLVTGNFFLTPATAQPDLVTVWKNLGRP